MAARTVEKPPGICINGNGWFHEGWLFGALGLPPRNFDEWDYPVRDVDMEGWFDGYNTAKETDLLTTMVCAKMRALGQLIVEVRPLQHEKEKP